MHNGMDTFVNNFLENAYGALNSRNTFLRVIIITGPCFNYLQKYATILS